MGAIARRIVSEEDFQIGTGVAESDAVSIDAGAAGLILAASGYTSNTTATFKVSVDGTNYYLVNGATVTLVAGEWVAIPDAVMYGKYLKIVIGANAVADEDLTLCLKG